MQRLILKSGLTLLVSALFGSVLVFALLRLLGGDVAQLLLGDEAVPGAVEALQLELGLNDPAYLQYWNWLVGLATGDLGTSYGLGYDIFDQIRIRIVPTVFLAVGTMIISVPLALILGSYAAIHVRQRRSVFVDVGAQIGLAIPAFWAGLLLVLLFAVKLGWFPATGWVSPSEDLSGFFRAITLPITALVLGRTAVMTRYARSSMIDVMGEDYILCARSRGRTLRGAALRHGLRNASIPLVTVGILQFGSLMVGAVVIENVFAIPGMGRLLVTGVAGREVIVVQSLVFVFLLMILILNFLLDILYGILDPRILDKPVRT